MEQSTVSLSDLLTAIVLEICKHVDWITLASMSWVSSAWKQAVIAHCNLTLKASSHYSALPPQSEWIKEYRQYKKEKYWERTDEGIREILSKITKAPLRLLVGPECIGEGG